MFSGGIEVENWLKMGKMDKSRPGETGLLFIKARSRL